MPNTASLGPGERRAALQRLPDERFDIVVIGAGVTGAGCALDAASRGLSVALIEQRDIASGTSSRSSKLIHGGLRYLEHFDFQLVWEALHERGLLLRKLAPHLVRPIRFVYPLRHRIWERAYVGSGIAIYDLMAATRRHPLPRHRHLSKQALRDRIPSLAPAGFVGGIEYSDATTDDARFTLAVVRTAVREGAVVASSVRAVGFTRSGRRISGVEAEDVETGDRFTIAGRVIVNATGVWADDIEQLAGDDLPNVTPSKGIHLVVPKDRIEAHAGVITRTDKSVLFIIPFGDKWVIGTTDTPWDLDLAHPAASRSDIEYLLAQVNRLLREPLSRADVVGVFTGLRPLVRGDASSTARLSREHVVLRPAPGLLTIVGGKYTTYRVMAEDTIDESGDDFARRPPRSRTAALPLLGADGFAALWKRRATIARAHHIEVATVERLLTRYGDELPRLLARMKERPDLILALPGSGGYLRAEIEFAVTDEAALHLDDVLTRRTRISIEVPDRGMMAAGEAASIMAEVLGWDETTTAAEINRYRNRVMAELESQDQADDVFAAAARSTAADSRLLGWR